MPEPGSERTRAQLVALLRLAYSAEKAAAYAYRGHAASVKDPAERAHILQVEQEEWHHRELVGGMLQTLGAKPNRIREAIFWCIGRAIGAFCRVGGWFAPMYGAGRLERHNIIEYEDAAVYAAACGEEGMIDCLLTMAEVEWEHELFFRTAILGHRLLRVFPLWEAPPAKEMIRARRASAA